MEVADIDKTGEIDNDTYTIHFCAPERMEEVSSEHKKNHMDDNSAFFCQPLPWKTILNLVKTIKKTKKKIIKIEITGHAANDGTSKSKSTMLCGPLSHEVLAFLLSQFPFDNKILLIQNKTCFGNSNLPKHSQLPFDYRKNKNCTPQLDESDDLCLVLMMNNDITQILSNAFLSVKKMCFYYGGVDKNQSGESDITFIQRKAKNLTDDTEEKFWNVKLSHNPYDKHHKQIMYEREQNRNKYCNRLRQDLQILQQLNNNQYNVDNDQYNFPPPPPQYQPQYGNVNVQLNYNNCVTTNFNNYLFPQQQQFVSPQQQYQQNTYGVQLNNNINNNTTNTNNGNVINNAMMQGGDNNISSQGNLTGKNNETVFCDLKSGICLGCKCW